MPEVMGAEASDDAAFLDSPPVEAMNARARLRAAAVRRVSGLQPARELRLILARALLERFGRDRPITLLDAGCEEGELALDLAQRNPAWLVEGIDIREDAISEARSSMRARGVTNAQFIRGDLMADLGSERYDAIAALECLTEIPDDRLAVSRMATALRHGGILVAHVPNRDRALTLEPGTQAWRARVLRHGYAPDDVRSLVEDAGLRLESVTGTTHLVVDSAQRLSDRVQTSSIKRRLLAHPLLASAAWLERLGLRLGAARELLLVARRP